MMAVASERFRFTERGAEDVGKDWEGPRDW